MDPELFKFPRTKHLFDAGGNGVSRDDLLMDQADAETFYSARGRRNIVSVEEKVDGANLGISISPKDYRILVQNRAHYVNSKTHKQFSCLDQWVEDHSAALFGVIEPGQHVLFGEWLHAKHSIHYSRLPGYFLAFDIYDRKAGKFLSRRERNRRLEDSGIPFVRLIAECPIRDKKHVLQLLDTPSAFYDGPCEGIYLRIDGDAQEGGAEDVGGFLLQRAKVVRPDFLQQIEEQWTRQKLTKNIVVFK
eukprot:m.53413 g.53413  ORF g.53413 m.53413 type:complete len:247 (+) comp34247_c0_seq2:1691-2431(+)